MTALLQVENLCKSYGAVRVTSGVDLDVRPGEVHAIIGPNGAGKTTLVHQIAGSSASDAGRIIFDGQDVTRWSMPTRVRAGLARSFQITSVFPRFTVLENVALAVQGRMGSSFRFWAAASRDAALRSVAEEMIATFGLATRIDITAETLSYGEKRHLELAMALATGPKLLLLDEPLAGTSHEESRQLVQSLRALKPQIAMLLVEHDMDAVFALADRVSVLVYGRLVATGTPSEIRADPEVRAAYLGEEAA